MNTKLKLTLVFILLTKILYGQQDPAYSLYMYNSISVNPAMAGSAETVSATALYRKQWAGIKGSPETQTLNVDAPVWNNKIGLGLSIVNDRIGVVQNLNINTQYAYRIRFERSTLSMGIQGGFNNYVADYTSVATSSQPGVTDNSFSQNSNQLIFNFGTGLYYYSEKLYAGISVPHIINQSLDGIQDGSGVRSRQYRHYYITAGYVFPIAEKFKIRPSTLLKLADGAPLQLDVSSNFWYDETFCLGFSYRTNDSFSTLVQIQVAKQLRIGYAFDYITSSLSRYTTGNNEVMLRFELRKKNTQVLTARYY